MNAPRRPTADPEVRDDAREARRAGPATTEPAVAQLLRLQGAAGNRAVSRLIGERRLLRDELAGATVLQPPASAPAAKAPAPDAVTAAGPAAVPWFTLIPWADEKTKVTAVYDKAGTVKVTYADRTAQELKDKHALLPPEPKPAKGAAAAPAPSAAPEPTEQERKEAEAARQKAIDDACSAIDAARAKLPGFAFPMATTGQYGEKWRGPGTYTRFTDVPPPPKPAPRPKKGGEKPQPPEPVVLTAQQQAAIESARSYRAFLDRVQADAAGVTAPQGKDGAPPTKAEVDRYIDALETRMFFALAAKEGGTDSINVYDSQIVTWGAGLGSVHGQAPTAMAAVAHDPTVVNGRKVGEEVTTALADAGIAFGALAGGRQSWVVVDTGKKVKFRDGDAAMLLKADPRLLMLLTHVSRGELPGMAPAAGVVPEPAAGELAPPAAATEPSAFQTALRKSVLEKQRHYFLTQHFTGANSIAKAIETLGQKWPFESLHVMLHCLWWGAGPITWHDFEELDGSPAPLVKAIAAVPAFDSYVDVVDGATVFKSGQMTRQMTKWFLGKENDVWGPELTLAKDKKLEAGRYCVDLGGGRYRQLIEPAARKP